MKIKNHFKESQKRYIIFEYFMGKVDLAPSFYKSIDLQDKFFYSLLKKL